MTSYLVVVGVVLAVVIPIIWNLGYQSGRVDTLKGLYFYGDSDD